MVTKLDELSRLKLRIADLERRITEAREDADDQPLGRAERGEMLDMLVRTLEAMRARKRAHERSHIGSHD
jgi:hypothetical protein